MKSFEHIKALREVLSHHKMEGKTIGLVPTMGYLHEGHISLMEAARAACDIVVVSIFVNPTQFAPTEDLATYPRDLLGDQKKCQEAGADYIFHPSVEEMYGDKASTIVNCEGPMTKTLCGKSRDTHFKGVTTVVAKLFNIVLPDQAFFGQKDAQQVAVIEKMVRELNFPVTIVPCPIVREQDGLALSSRNTYLSQQERQEALVLSESLKLAEQMIQQGAKKSALVLEAMKAHIHTASSARIEYIQIVSAKNLEDIDILEGDLLMAMAVYIGKTRLIDNRRFLLD